MDKFSKLDTKKEENPKENNTSDSKIQIINYKDYDFVKESDMVIILPYFVDEGHIYLRYEYVPTYQYRNKDTPELRNEEKYLTVISGTVEQGEKLNNTVRRELYEEAGVILHSMYPIEKMNSLFVNKGNCAKYHLYILDIRYNEYRQTKPPTDGSESEKKSYTVKVDMNYFDDIKTNDTITELMLDKLRLRHNLKK